MNTRLFDLASQIHSVANIPAEICSRPKPPGAGKDIDAPDGPTLAAPPTVGPNPMSAEAPNETPPMSGVPPALTPATPENPASQNAPPLL